MPTTSKPIGFAASAAVKAQTAEAAEPIAATNVGPNATNSAAPAIAAATASAFIFSARKISAFESPAVMPSDLFISPNVCVALLRRTVIACDNVGTVFPNFSSMPAAAAVNASNITCAVILPSGASFNSSPRVKPKRLAIASAAFGISSITERNSSPSNLPLLNACESCNNAEPASLAVAPDTTSILLTVSVRRNESCCDLPRFFNAISKRVKAWAVS